MHLPLLHSRKPDHKRSGANECFSWLLLSAASLIQALHSGWELGSQVYPWKRESSNTPKFWYFRRPLLTGQGRTAGFPVQHYRGKVNGFELVCKRSQKHCVMIYYRKLLLMERLLMASRHRGLCRWGKKWRDKRPFFSLTFFKCLEYV